MPPTLLVTVDSLRRDHLEYMPETRATLDRWHDAAFATSTATLGSFPGIITGTYPGEPEINPERSVTTAFDDHRVGVTTNHLLSERYRYDAGFDKFTSPHSGRSVKDEIGRQFTIGSRFYQLASAAWGIYQSVRDRLGGMEKSFRPADSVVDEFLDEIEGSNEWFGWLHFMEPHYPYDPDGAPMGRARAQSLTRTVIAGDGTPDEQEQVKDLYRMEVAELDTQLATLWDALPSETRIVFCADHGELLGEDGMWGHPGEVRPELLHVPLGTSNTPECGDLMSLIDVPSLLTGNEWGEGTFDRDVAFASYGGKKAAIDGTHIASEDGTQTLDGEEASAPALERRLSRFEPDHVVKEDAAREDLEDLGYL